MRTPFASPRQFGRVLIKALVLLILFDAAQIAFDLAGALDRWLLYRLFTPPTERLGLADQIGDPIWWTLDPLLAAHQIAQSKAPDEFRVIFLGDSATFCLYCRSTEAIPSLFTQLGATFDGKRVVGYNLAYPGSDWLKDVLILKHALKYQPDAIVWLVTAKGTGDQPLPQEPDAHLITRLNAAELPALAGQFNLDTWEMQRYADADAWTQRSIFTHGGRYRDGLILVARSFRNALIYPNKDLSQEYLLPGEPVTTKPIQAVAEINSALPGYGTFPNRQWELLRAGQQLANEAGVPLLIVNEPTYIGSGPHSDANYNSFYERNLYDRFRAALTDFTRQHALAYLDLWDLLPPDNFSNTPLHYTLDGNRRVAQKLLTALSTMH
ncbi:MAG TPA: hypothetical protein VFF59_09755 [Anaerolineae bacterium]|nr:hypothetical protein [Anaerolineae bacterium]